MYSIGDCDEISDILGISTVIVVLITEEELSIVVSSGQYIAATFFQGEQSIGDISAIGTSSGGRLSAWSVEDRIGGWNKVNKWDSQSNGDDLLKHDIL